MTVITIINGDIVDVCPTTVLIEVVPPGVSDQPSIELGEHDPARSADQGAWIGRTIVRTPSV
jgi:hypothetical protein